MIADFLHIAMAGLWAEVWRYGLGVGLIVCLVAAAIFSPLFKKEFCWAATVVAAFLTAFTMGVTTGEQRVRAQWDAATAVTIKNAEKARTDSERDIEREPAGGLSNDRYDRDNH